MDENMETMELTEDQVSSAWDDEPANQPAETDTQEPQETQAPQATTEQPAPDQPADQPELFILKNRDETRQVTRDELVSMAQKGWDYDKVREERDQLRQYREEANPALELVKAYAAKNNMSMPDYLNFCRVQELKAQGMDQRAAEQKVQFERERAELDKEKNELQQERQQRDEMQRRAQQAQEARQRDIQNFWRAYPNIDPKTIPQEVWDAVKKGESLTNAYTMHENQRLQAEISALKQNEKNKRQSPGSLGGGISESQADLISRLWDEAD